MIASPWNYIFWLFIFIWAPAAFLWFIDLGQIRRHARKMLACSALLTVMCVPVEYWIVREALIMHQGHHLGLYWLGLPLEDYLFFISFPYLLAPVALKLDDMFRKGAPC